jgi:response regulator NasT
MADRSLSILVLDESRARAAVIEAGLREAGHDDVTVVASLDRSARRIEEMSPDVILIGLEGPGRERLEQMLQLSRAVRRPVALVVDGSDPDSLARAEAAGVLAYVAEGLRPDRVKSILDGALSRFRAGPGSRPDEVEGRRLVDRAKRLLMAQRRIGEGEAYAVLRRTAMNRSRRIADIAEALVAGAEA